MRSKLPPSPHPRPISRISPTNRKSRSGRSTWLGGQAICNFCKIHHTKILLCVGVGAGQKVPPFHFFFFFFFFLVVFFLHPRARVPTPPFICSLNWRGGGWKKNKMSYLRRAKTFISPSLVFFLSFLSLFKKQDQLSYREKFFFLLSFLSLF